MLILSVLGSTWFRRKSVTLNNIMVYKVYNCNNTAGPIFFLTNKFKKKANK